MSLQVIPNARSKLASNILARFESLHIRATLKRVRQKKCCCGNVDSIGNTEDVNVGVSV